MSLCKWTATALLLLGLAIAPRMGAQEQSKSQTAQASQTTPAPPAAKPADVASPDTILAAVYEVISGPAGQARDWDRFRSLYLPGARLVPTGPKKEGGGFFARTMTPDEYVARATPFFEKEGFYEKEAARRMERYGNIVQVFSTYESRHDPKEAPFARGINSFQLFFDGTRWWVVTVFWQAETADNPIPKEFLPAAR
ncbi:MAG TPA: hypothetical protein VEX69_07655 [Candidatus Limnocylindria bacterium]|nr:hypothetical protein [Candidatus Limnocylindria bacterium]